MHVPEWRVKQAMGRYGLSRGDAYRRVCAEMGARGAMRRLERKSARARAEEKRRRIEAYKRSRPDLYE